MHNRKMESKKNFNHQNSLNVSFYCSYNKNVSKNKFKNSLKTSDISYFNNLLETVIPKEAQIAQEAYSKESDIFNKFYRLNKEEYEQYLKASGLNVNETKDYRNNFKKERNYFKRRYYSL